MKLNKEAIQFLESIDPSVANEVFERTDDFYLYGDLSGSRKYFKDLESSLGKKVPTSFKRNALDGFEGDMAIMADITENQSDSLLLSLLRKISTFPEAVEAIFDSDKIADRYFNVVCKAYAHASKRDYFSPTKQRRA